MKMKINYFSFRHFFLFICITLLISIVILYKGYELLSYREFITALKEKQISFLYENDISCYENESSVGSLELFDPSEIKDEKNIFFHETSCFGEYDAIFKVRQACAVESAAKWNPDMTVYLLFLSPSPLSDHSKILVENLKKYKNIKIRRLIVRDYFMGTPLEKWYVDRELFTSYWPSIHMSDYLRFLTLWKFGSTYLDLDVVIMKSLQNLTDFAGEQSSDTVAVGAMSLSKSEIGRKIINGVIEDLRSEFRGDEWGNSGPSVLTRTLKKLCDLEMIEEVLPFKSCNGFKVLPPNAFYPIYFNDWKQYFNTQNLEMTMEKLKDSYAIHVWNKLSKNETLHPGDKVPYTIIAEQNCPEVHKHSGPFF